MSSQPQHPPLPAAWVGRIFERFAAEYGSQKLAATWRDSDTATVQAAWAQRLGRFDRATLAGALNDLASAHPSWPPTLGEFVALCEAQVVPEAHRPVLPVPKRTADEIERGRQQMARIRGMLRGSVRAMP